MLSVRRVLDLVGLGADLSKIPAALLDAATERGRIVHEALAALAEDKPYEVWPDCAGYVDAARDWMRNHAHVPQHSEIDVVSRLHDYHGHIDRVGLIDGRLSIIDWKTPVTMAGSALRYAGYQQAAYALAWEEEYEVFVLDCWVVHLKANGKAIPHLVEREESERVWLAALTVAKAQLR